MGSDDEIDVHDGMTMILQHERVQALLNMLTRYELHLWMIASSIEDGSYNTLLMIVVLTS